MSKECHIKALKGKLKITSILKLETGLHIGAASDFCTYWGGGQPLYQDPYTKQPIIPGSSLKGKLRTLLARSLSDTQWLNEINEDKEEIKVLFGTADKNRPSASRLQFADMKLTEDSLQRIANMDLDTYIGEVKFENSINRITAVATPRQIERVPAGTEFAVSLVYNVEDVESVDADMKLLAAGIRLLEMDYLGGHGSRGYGRVSFRDFQVEAFSINEANQVQLQALTSKLTNILEGSC